MKMNRKNTTTILTTILLLTLTLFSCKDSFLSQPKENSDGKTYLVVKSADIFASDRSIEPDMKSAFARMKNVILWGTQTKNAAGEAVSGTRTKLSYSNSEYTLQNLLDSVILLENGAGEYTFELEGSLDGVIFYQQLTEQTISASQTNSISFTLTPKNKDNNDNYTDFGDFGGIDIKLTYNIEKTSVSKVMVTVTSVNANAEPQEIETKTLGTSGSGNNRTVEYKRWASTTTNVDTNQIASGTYRVTFDFYMDSETIINSLPYIVHVVRGLNSIYEDTVDLNEVYSITYNNISNTVLAGGQVQPVKYTRKSSITLPRLKKNNYIFQGWFTTNEYKPEDQVFSLPSGNLENKTLYAYFVSAGETPTLYVNPSATYHYGNSETYGLSSLDEAFEIVRYNITYSKAWKIMLTGEVKGPQSITADKIGTKAKSITIQGTQTTGTEPLNIINGDFKAPTSNGAALAITTTVPVTLNNIKITGGNNDGTGEIKGGGLYVGSWVGNDRPTVTLAGGTVITGNTAENGGGVYVEGLLKMNTSTIAGNVATQNGGGMYCEGMAYINQQAVIGDMSATTAASSATACSNYAAGNGGGLYVNAGSVYLGCTTTPGSNVDLATPNFTGGIFYNYASNGGGVYVTGGDSSNVSMYAGTLANNGVPAEGHGGAVYQDITPSNYGCIGGFAMCYKAIVLPGNEYKHDIYLSKANTTLHVNRSKINSIDYNFNHDDTVSVYAQITPSVYEEGIKILDDFNVTDVSSFVNKFVITPQIDTENNKKIIWALNETSNNNTITLRKVSEETLTNSNNTIVVPASTDFVTIDEAAYYGITGMENHSVGPDEDNPFLFPKMQVLKREVTQAEYESFMTYESTDYAPTESEEQKSTTSAYYVSWAEALIYCNLLSIHQGLQPVYQMKVYENGQEKLYTDPADWMKETRNGICIRDGKYYVDPSKVWEDEYQSPSPYWQQDFNDGSSIIYDDAANGYRLPLVQEWGYITNLAMAGTISGMTDNSNKNVSEWCSGCNYMGDLSQSYVEQSMGEEWGDSYVHDDAKPYVHQGMGNLGFRIVRYTLQDDFALVEGSSSHDVYNGDYDTLQRFNLDQNATGPCVINDLLVQMQEVTQADYEVFMTYQSGYEPTETGAAKKTTPVYNISWAEAVVYCNMLSIAHNLTPVYGIYDVLSATNKTSPLAWAEDSSVTGVTIEGDKFYVIDLNNDNQNELWIPDDFGGQFHIDEDANGYRLPTTTEWAYISDMVKNASTNDEIKGITDNTSKNVYEWCRSFDRYGGESNHYYATGNMGTDSFTTVNLFTTTNEGSGPEDDSFVRVTSHSGTSNIGFRVVRNLTVNP